MILPAMIPVASSKIDAVGYDEMTQALFVRFKNDTVWRYFPVSAEQHNEMMTSESIGAYHGKLAKNVAHSGMMHYRGDGQWSVDK